MHPYLRSEKVICVGMNYADHCYEQNQPLPVEPVIFRSVALPTAFTAILRPLTALPPCTPHVCSKFPTSIAASGDPLVSPAETSCLDYEVELAVVIGREGRRIPEASAMEYVAGFTVAHDVSARDWQLKKNGGQWLLGKACDGFAPIGPSIVTPDEVGDHNNLWLRTTVNGVELQAGNTKELVHGVEKCAFPSSRIWPLCCTLSSNPPSPNLPTIITQVSPGSPN
jgi:2-keto-4-pentenoate hydratase/2-oxohepta-3-ene-1,7-dioic acid hydratase in catechol pathway